MFKAYQSAPLSLFGYLKVIVAASIFSIFLCMAALAMGSVSISFIDVLKILLQTEDSLVGRIVLDIRLPRIMTGFCVGGMLAIAGSLMQVLLRNPLADPYILGVSGGSSAFALLSIIAGVTGLWVNLSAFLGALLSILLVFFLSRSNGEWSSLRTLLTGVVLAAGWGALISFLLAISPSDRVHGMLFWLMGDISFSTYSLWNFVLLVIGLIASLSVARALNLLAIGELNASALGVSVIRLNYFIYFLASFLTAAAVMQAGSIGFVGLVIPHIVRLLFGNDHLLLLTISAMLGGSFLVFADSLARTIVAPQQLPVGVLTAMIGVPLFLVLLQSVFAKKTS